ncbi:MAG: hypothetical protein JO305_05575 [Alphaproteobacteria bacterium]|nr:hypothetical protein [Alphaproteobacteria bacterium]
MLKKFLGAAIALGLVALLAVPFGREIYYRYEVWHRLGDVGDSDHRAAFQEWNGSARGFERQLRDQCLQVYGTGAPQCERYRDVSN